MVMRGFAPKAAGKDAEGVRGRVVMRGFAPKAAGKDAEGVRRSW